MKSNLALLIMSLALGHPLQVFGQTPYAFFNGYYSLEGDSGRITSIKFDPNGTSAYGANILSASGRWAWLCDGAEITAGAATSATDSSSLTISGLPGSSVWTMNVSGPNLTSQIQTGLPGALRMEMDLVYVDGGFYDRAQGQNYSPTMTVDMPFQFFYNRINGQGAPVEFFKQCAGQTFEYTWQNVYCVGRHGCDLRLNPLCGPIRFSPAAQWLRLWCQGGAGNASISLAVLPKATETILSGGHGDTPLPNFYVEPATALSALSSASSTYDVNALLNEFYLHSTFWWGGTAASGIWSDWSARAFAFADCSYRDELQNFVRDWIVDDDGYGRQGYAYTWGTQLGWPFPQGYDTRHFDTNAVLITSVWRLISWLGDTSYLGNNGVDNDVRRTWQDGVGPASLLEKVRQAWDYQQNYMNTGEAGVILLNGKAGDHDHEGVGLEDVGTNYYDILPFGYLDGMCSLAYYNSTLAMADIERMVGNQATAENILNEVRPKARYAFNDNFWITSADQDHAQRYCGSIDKNADVHDFGFTFLNTMALEAGLTEGFPGRAEAIFKWLDDGQCEKDGVWRPDIYSRWIFAPRCNTINNYFWYSAPPGSGLWVWDHQIQNGGADLYESGFDIIARAKHQSADKAWDRLRAILRRYTDPDRLCMKVGYYGEEIQGGGTAGAVGWMRYEFPETGVLGSAFLYAFVGADISWDGLCLTPKIPTGLTTVGARHLSFRGGCFDLCASADRVRIDCTQNSANKTFYLNGAPYAGVFSATAELINGSALLGDQPPTDTPTPTATSNVTLTPTITKTVTTTRTPTIVRTPTNTSEVFYTPTKTRTRTPTSLSTSTVTPIATNTLLPPATQTPGCHYGDADGNLFVNVEDYRAVRDNFGRPSPVVGDADCNRFVNSNDYRSVRDHFGQNYHY